MTIGSFDDERAPRRPEHETVGPHAVAPGVWRIVLPLPFPPSTVNCYLLHGAGEWALVDCGLGLRGDGVALTDALASLGVTYADLTTLALTHAHPDHIGHAGAIAAAMGGHARVTLLESEAQRMYDVWSGGDERAFAIWGRMQLMGGIDADEAAAGMAGMARLAARMRLPDPATIAPLRDGQTTRLGGRDWRVIWTPGHAEGQMCLLSDQMLITADHILPAISPNVSFYPLGRPDPIADYLTALATIAALDLRDPLALPGHGGPFSRLGERIGELRAGTERRGRAALAALGELTAPATALEAARIIFHGRLLRGDDRRLAVGETLAHLEHLRLTGMVTRQLDGDAARYALVAG